MILYAWWNILRPPRKLLEKFHFWLKILVKYKEICDGFIFETSEEMWSYAQSESCIGDFPRNPNNKPSLAFIFHQFLTGKKRENKWQNAIFQRSLLPARFMMELQKLLVKYSNKGVRLLLERRLQLGILRQIKSSGTLMLNAQFNKETTGLHLSLLCAMKSPRIGFCSPGT